MAAPIVKFYGVRVNVPQVGPVILPFQTSVDLNAVTCMFNGAGVPADGLLLGRTNYIVGDLYTDTTNKNLWTCTAPGTNATSTWAQISGGAPPLAGGGISIFGSDISYAQGAGVYVAGLGTFWAKIASSGIAPTYPENANWKLIAFDVQQAGVCVANSAASIYINSSAPF